ncbi:hypothetical protein RFI_25050 [Reticulomyxa filosa]|uniref:Uncharacterized protein n=1 Tax=Reticulomyxa filosa TaxID=46433 RepID=X6MFX8_RETFI|nr:hypothetical protein RFI_25050 [Reticulomyxa filosa]|eukprot:ETO12327.1 hypothetical protein RFI_25050 [Reticulomyxa filosa]
MWFELFRYEILEATFNSMYVNINYLEYFFEFTVQSFFNKRMSRQIIGPMVLDGVVVVTVDPFVFLWIHNNLFFNFGFEFFAKGELSCPIIKIAADIAFVIVDPIIIVVVLHVGGLSNLQLLIVIKFLFFDFVHEFFNTRTHCNFGLYIIQHTIFTLLLISMYCVVLFPYPQLNN